MNEITNFTDIKYIKFLESTTNFSAIEELASVFKDTPVCKNVKKVIKCARDRESVLGTGIGGEIALPHAKVDSVTGVAFAVGISKEGIDFDSMDSSPCKLIFLVIAGVECDDDYLKLLSNIMVFLKNTDVKDKILSAKSPEEVYEILQT